MIQCRTMEILLFFIKQQQRRLYYSSFCIIYGNRCEEGRSIRDPFSFNLRPNALSILSPSKGTKMHSILILRRTEVQVEFKGTTQL